jgi:hypothetical protein
MRWTASQGVRLDRRDVQRIGLLPHRLPGRREEVDDGCRFLVVVIIGEWRLLLIFDIIEVRGESLARVDRFDRFEGFGRLEGNLTGGSRRHVRSIT